MHDARVSIGSNRCPELTRNSKWRKGEEGQ